MPNGRVQQSKGASAGILLGVLNAIERDSRVTQRHIARELNIALGLANAYLRRCANKGLIKMREVPLNRYAYYLTPRGFSEKSRLTAEYLSYSLDFFRQARRDCSTLLQHCHANGWRRAVLYGAGDLAEIAVLSATDVDIEIVCIVDPSGGRSCAGRSVVASLGDAIAINPSSDVIVVTDVRSPQESFMLASAAAAAAGLPPGRVLAPRLIQVGAATTRKPK